MKDTTTDHEVPKGSDTERQEMVSDIIKSFQQLEGSRGTLEQHWQEIAERVDPNASFSFQGQYRQPGEKRNTQVYDSTATVALERFSAILDSLLTPRNSTWHRLTTDNPTLERNRSVQLWFEQVNQILFKFRYSEKANFASQNHQNYRSVGAYGTGGMFTDQLIGDRGLRYRAIHVGELFFAENHQGVIDKVFRRFKLTARQAVQKWPETITEEIQNQAKINPEREYVFLHYVCPKDAYDPDRSDYKGMPYASYYIALEGRALLSEGGYRSFPYQVPRWEQALGEVYGRSPAMLVLPAIKTLNEEKKTVLKAGHRIVDPVLLAHDDGVLGDFSLKPGSVNYGGVSSDGRPLVHALQTGNLQIGKELMDDERQVINDAFLVSIFQILADPRAMTATEVMERTREKAILLAPTVGRLQSEYLSPLIEREIDLLAQQGLLPPMPRMLLEAKGEYRIEYDSPLSRTQRAEESAGIMRTIEALLPVVNVTQDATPLHFFNWDVITPEVAANNGAPVRWMRTLDEVNKMRQAQAQQQQVQQAIQAAPAAAAVMKANAKAPGAGQ